MIAKDCDQLLTQNQTRLDGLKKNEVEERLKKYGPNQITTKNKKNIIFVFLEEFKDMMVIILLIATVIAALSGEEKDAIVIFIVVIANALIGFIQKFKAEKAIEALRNLITPKAHVIRDGVEQMLNTQELVPGDIIYLEEGNHIPTDAIIIEANELQTQESILTGESLPVPKFTYDIPQTYDTLGEKENIIYMGTIVTQGTARAIVTATGMNTEMGKIATLTLETQKDLSPLQKELKDIGTLVGKLAVGISLVLFIIGYLIQGQKLIDSLLFSVSVAVAAVPEGLPATITIALAIGVQRLARKNAIVKQLSSVETLGCTTVICSDKTGTLTKNEMTVKKLYMDELECHLHGAGYEPNGNIEIYSHGKLITTIGSSIDINNLSKNHSNILVDLKLFLSSAGLCNNASLIKEKDQWTIIGDPTEGALLTMVEKTGIKLSDLHNRFEKVGELPFDSSRKRMSVILKEISTGAFIVFTKGAPDSIIEVSSHFFSKGRSLKLDKENRDHYEKINEKMASSALRGLAFAYRELAPREVAKIIGNDKTPPDYSHLEDNLTLLGVAGMIDPPRPEVKEAVELAYKAGIRTYIITGDHGLTAEAIASELKLIGRPKRSHYILTGNDINLLPDHELKKALSDKNLDIIFARVSPEHKLRIVKLLKELGEIVAVTGDGVNDAPALKKADIGIAMGITGTDVSREAANMVLADDSYSTIINAIKEGRTIYDNLRKFVFYMFSSNIGELVTIFTAIIIGLHSPLIAIMVLFINLYTDLLPAIALGVDPANSGIMEHPPRNQHLRIMNRSFIKHCGGLGIYIGIVTTIIYIITLLNNGWTWGTPIHPDSQLFLKASTAAFITIIMMEIVNAYNSRNFQVSIFKLNPFSNLYLLGAISFSLLGAIAAIHIPFFQEFLHTTPLNINEWLVIVLASLSLLVVEEIRKFTQKHA